MRKRRLSMDFGRRWEGRGDTLLAAAGRVGQVVAGSAVGTEGLTYPPPRAGLAGAGLLRLWDALRLMVR